MRAAGHPSLHSTYFDEVQWQTWLAHDLCAEPLCLSAADPPGEGEQEVIPPPISRRIQGRVWWQNGTMDDAFGPEYRRYCFTCAYWHRMHDDDNDPANPMQGVVIEGTTDDPTSPFGPTGSMVHFCYDSNEPFKKDRDSFLGFGGRVFHIRLKGHPDFIQTNNLWAQGAIPAWLEHLFQVNADFV